MKTLWFIITKTYIFYFVIYNFTFYEKIGNQQKKFYCIYRFCFFICQEL